MHILEFHSFVLVLVALSPFLHLTGAHSWVERLQVIHDNGSYIGDPGYPRGYAPRGAGFSDPLINYLIEDNGTNPYLCHPNQHGGQTPGFPTLVASPSSTVALQYQENGHVSIPTNQPGKPANRGTVFIYTTTQPKSDEKYLDVFGKWTADGKGGDQRGKLLSSQNFDDGQCTQVNGHPISNERLAAHEFKPADPYGADIWCQNNIVIPADAEVGKRLTVYWVWSWPTAPGIDSNLQYGKNETYSTCMDIQITAASPKSGNTEVSKNIKYAEGQDVQKAGVSSYIAKLGGGKNIYVQTDATFVAPPPATGSAASAPSSALPPTSQAAPPHTSSAAAIASSSVPQPTSGVAPVVNPVPTGTTSVNAPAPVSSPTSTRSGPAAISVSFETIYVYPSSTGLVAPTGGGYSFSTAVPSGPIMSEPAPSGSGPVVPVVAPPPSTAVTSGSTSPVATTPAAAIGPKPTTTISTLVTVVPYPSTQSSLASTPTASLLASASTPAAPSGVVGTGNSTSNPTSSDCKPKGVRKRSVVFGGQDAKRSKIFVEEPVEEAINSPPRLRRSAKFR